MLARRRLAGHARRRPPGGRRGALRAGAGMVRVGAPGLDADRSRPRRRSASPCPPTGWDAAVLDAARRFRALVVGPGLGRDAAAGARGARRAGRRRPSDAASTPTASRLGRGRRRPPSSPDAPARPCSRRTTASSRVSPVTPPAGRPPRRRPRPGGGHRCGGAAEGIDHDRRGPRRRGAARHDGRRPPGHRRHRRRAQSGVIGALPRAGVPAPPRGRGGRPPARPGRRPRPAAAGLVASDLPDLLPAALAEVLRLMARGRLGRDRSGRDRRERRLALRRVAAPAEVCAVVKAYGYGHGAARWPAPRSMRGRRGWRWPVDEAVQLREAGIEAPILLLSEPRPCRWPR